MVREVKTCKGCGVVTDPYDWCEQCEKESSLNVVVPWDMKDTSEPKEFQYYCGECDLDDRACVHMIDITCTLLKAELLKRVGEGKTVVEHMGKEQGAHEPLYALYWLIPLPPNDTYGRGSVLTIQDVAPEKCVMGYSITTVADEVFKHWKSSFCDAMKKIFPSDP